MDEIFRNIGYLDKSQLMRLKKHVDEQIHLLQRRENLLKRLRHGQSNSSESSKGCEY
ncbi:MAG: hypothetical protein ACOC3V_03330 [bacterium]